MWSRLFGFWRLKLQRIAAIIALIGIGLAALSYWPAGATEAILIEVGIGMLLAGIALFFEPWLMREVERVATEAATDVVESARENLIALNQVADIQANEIRRRRDTMNRLFIEAEEDTTCDTYCNLLSIANAEGWIESNMLLKSSISDDEVLFKVSLSNPRGGEEPSSSRAISFTMNQLQEFPDDGLLYSPVKNTTIYWRSDEDVATLAARLVAGYERSRMSVDRLSVGYLLRQVVDSCRLAYDAHSAMWESATGPFGRVRFLINDDWALTDVGLEGIRTRLRFRPWREYFDGMHHDGLFEASCPAGYDEVLWNEAKKYCSRLRDLTGERY